ncbi:rod shape-determining protein MreC [Desulfatibacillum aliphaticivorans]|uniref:Cell shape-determining protein MreC n=1 Tax=Desulfatibacillum aliphaticivorans TaxID=218208 RepID=B8FGU4_DESAL|nr:rod shape-determining protein MreC [Desulfatibacillum aliphaticivorans]ACL05324.1 rod shape-determining protein MreC [Desulfatibacillum aliphaticivorans]
MFSKKMGTALALILFFMFTAVLLPTFGTRGGQEHPADGVFQVLIAPFQDGVTRISSFVSTTWTNYFALVETARENKELRREVEFLQLIAHECGETRRQNSRLKNLLGFAQDEGGKVVTALVTAEDPSDTFQAIYINRGSIHGVEPGLAVATPLGVVGRIIDVSPYQSKVLLITDPNFAMDARVARTRARGVLEGAADGPCQFKYVMQQEDVSLGDMVVTSGMDKVFPPGISVGVVSRVRKAEQGMFQGIVVTPFVDFSRLEEVLVLLNSEPPPEQEMP